MEVQTSLWSQQPKLDSLVSKTNNNNNNKSSRVLKKEQFYLLCEYYSDVTLSRTLRCIEQMDRQAFAAATASEVSIPLFMQLLHPESAHHWARQPVTNCLLGNSNSGVRQEAASLAFEMGMTGAQFEIFAHFVQRKLELVQGPAGTGKTHFLATLILTWLYVHKIFNQPTVIILSAFTHSAIDNLLDKLITLYLSNSTLQTTFNTSNKPLLSTLSSFTPSSPPFVSRLVSTYDFEQQRERYSNCRNMVKVIQTHELKSRKSAFSRLLQQQQQLLIAGSVWSVDKLPSHVVADVVIVEEASQMPLANTCFPLQRLKPTTGQLLLVGV
jgi:hypothetical protein